MKIFLIGFMGSGKSTIGRELADRLGFDFLDLDEVIEKSAGLPVVEIFARQGEPAFRRLEAGCLRQTLPLRRTVVATGGGTPCFYQNMEWMNNHGVSVFLDIPPATLAGRLENDSTRRPLLKGKTGRQLADLISHKLASREAFYHLAHFTCHADAPPPEIAAALTDYFLRFDPGK